MYRAGKFSSKQSTSHQLIIGYLNLALVERLYKEAHFIHKALPVYIPKS
jgi:hypothetical protein